MKHICNGKPVSPPASTNTAKAKTGHSNPLPPGQRVGSWWKADAGKQDEFTLEQEQISSVSDGYHERERTAKQDGTAGYARSCIRRFFVQKG